MSIRYGGPADDYPGFATYLHSVFGAGLAPIAKKWWGDTIDPFSKAILDSVETPDIRYLRWVAGGGVSPSWHTLDLVDERVDGGYPIQFAASLEVGLAALIQHALDGRVRITSVSQEDSVLKFWGTRGLLAVLSPTVFSQPNSKLAERIESAFRGVAMGDRGRLVARLNVVPGLEALCDDWVRPGRSNEVAREPHAYEHTAHPSASNIAKALKRGLSRYLSIEVPLSKMQETLARALGVTNWATLVSLEERCKHAFLPVIVQELSSEHYQRRAFYHNMIDALAGLAELTPRLLSAADALCVSPDTQSIRISDARYNSMDVHSVDRLPSVYVASECWAEEPELALARAVLSHSLDITTLFDSAVGSKASLSTIDRTLGKRREDVLYLAKHVFSKDRSGEKTHLIMEEVDEGGERVPNTRRGLALYKG